MRKTFIAILIAILILPNTSGLIAYALESGENDVNNSNHRVNITVQNIPENIKNLKLLVEGTSGNRYLLRKETKGLNTTSVEAYLPPDLYRIRVIGYNGGVTLPNVKMGGEIKSLVVSEEGTTNGEVSLEEINIELNASTPKEVEVGSKLTIKMDIYDPANFLDRASQGRLWWNEGKGNKQIWGKISKVEDKKYQFAIDVEAPVQAGKVTYYFSEHNSLFKNPEGNETPYLTSPDFELAVKEKQPNTKITVENIPTTIKNLKLLVEGSKGKSYLLREETNGLKTTNVEVNLPSDEYRIRVIGYNGGVTFPNVKMGGEIKSLVVSEEGITNGEVSLEPMEVELNASTPAKVKVGSKLTIKMDIYDPANFLDRVSQGRLWWNEGNGTKQTLGKVSKLEDHKYEFTIDVTAPVQPNTATYYFSEHNSLFKNPEGNEAPFLTSETYEVEIGDVNSFLKVNDISQIDTKVTGESQVSSTVYVKINDDLYQSAVVNDGSFSVEIPSQSPGTLIEVWAKDEHGQKSDVKILTVKDVIPPHAPVVNEVSDQDTVITGMAEEGASVSVKVATEEIGLGKVNENDQFSIKIPVQKAGTEIIITATDEAGNESEPSAVIVIDVTAPIVTGIANQSIYNTSVTIEFNEGVATLNGKKFESGTKVVEEGSYELNVVDQAGNTTIVHFEIDKTSPEITGVANQGVYNTSVTIQFNEGKATLNRGSIETGTEVETEGKYELIVTDKAGNVTTVNFEIDKTSPEITGVANQGVYNTSVTIQFNEGKATLNGESIETGTEVEAEGKYELIVTDKAGNVTTVYFDMDKTAPKVTGVTDKGIYNKSVTIAFNEGEATLNGKEIANGSTVEKEGTYQLIVTDAAGNKTTMSFEIDKTAPEVTGVTNQGVYETTVTIGFNEGEATLNGELIQNGTELKQEGQYQLIVTDFAGNQTVVNFTIKKKESIVISFPDVSEQYTFYKEINFLVSRSVISGYADGTFKPGKSVTRAEAAIMIGRALGLDGTKRNTSFSDVGAASVASGYIQSAVEAGIINGFPDGTYRPNESVTRGQLAIFLSRAFNLTDTAPVNFSDVSKNSVAYEYIGRLVAANITMGYGDNTFRPNDAVTRGQFSAFLTRAIQYVER
ncbi:S-layer homology domain-containing protein [Bacillus massiliigorillae]|uniref:S-layer homology domain-containing protein n=1 Tax=Bacillus massiliigorillae TaxID=1243664 RepID=UPI00039D0FA1|nr:S-layer homology domain-containing protein [Bacillus massiliigorillae]